MREQSAYGNRIQTRMMKQGQALPSPQVLGPAEREAPVAIRASTSTRRAACTTCHRGRRRAYMYPYATTSTAMASNVYRRNTDPWTRTESQWSWEAYGRPMGGRGSAWGADGTGVTSCSNSVTVPLITHHTTHQRGPLMRTASLSFSCANPCHPRGPNQPSQVVIAILVLGR